MLCCCCTAIRLLASKVKIREKKLSFFDDTVIGFVIYIYEYTSQRIYFLVTVAVAGTVHALELPEVQQVMCG